MIPKLWKQHPNFFVVYFITAVSLHLGLGITQFTDQERYSNPVFQKMFKIMPVDAWAWGSLLVFGLMTVGAYYQFHIWGRIGLGLGLFLCLARGLLIELGPGSGAGIFVWLTVAGLHFAQLSEPPINPLTQKE